MRQCEDCKIILEDDVRYCPKCGKSVADDAAAEEPDMRLAALLTSANLHKIRQDWDAAIADATQALELDPNNADVASILASIYEQKGNRDEAAVWYRIALDLDPKNKATKARLGRVSAANGTARAGVPWWHYLIATTVATALVVVTVILTLALARPQTRDAHPTRSRERTTSAAPTVRSTSTTPPSSLTGPVESRETTGQATTRTGVSKTSGELALTARITQSQAVGDAGASLDDLVADPRQGIVIVTFSLPTTTPVTRSRVLSAAWLVARDAFAASSEAKFVTARCMIAPGGPSTVLIAFVGDIARASVEAMAANPTQAQLDQAFTTKWWSPQVK